MRDADSIKDNIPFNAELEDRTTEEWCAQVAGLQNEITRLRAALTEIQRYNNINNDRDAYLYELADWALGEQAERPDPVQFGLEP